MNIFLNQQTRLLKKVSKKYCALIDKKLSYEKRKNELLSELELINAFEQNPFLELNDLRLELEAENKTFIPDLLVNNGSDNIAQLSIYYNDLSLQIMTNASDLSLVGWHRLYKKCVAGSNEQLRYKAFYRAIEPHLRPEEKAAIKPKDLTMYEDYFNVIDDKTTMEKWKNNLVTIDKIKELLSTKRKLNNPRIMSSNIDLSLTA